MCPSESPSIDENYSSGMNKIYETFHHAFLGINWEQGDLPLPKKESEKALLKNFTAFLKTAFFAQNDFALPVSSLDPWKNFGPPVKKVLPPENHCPWTENIKKLKTQLAF